MDTALNNRKMNTSQEDEYLMRILDKGIDDMEAGRDEQEFGSERADRFECDMNREIREIGFLGGMSYLNFHTAAQLP